MNDNENEKAKQQEEERKQHKHFLALEREYFDMLGLDGKLKDKLRTIIHMYLMSHDLMT